MKEILHRKEATPAGPAGTQRGTEQRGIPVVLLNPEELFAESFGNINILSTSVTVDDSPTALPAISLSDRKRLLIYNLDPKTLYIGGSGVTESTGLPVPSGLFQPFHLFPIGSAQLFGIYPSGSGDVRVMEIA